MTVGIPDDMRRTAFVSVAGHLVLLAALTAVPLLKTPLQGTASYQVTLVSSLARPAPALPPAVPSAPTPIEREQVVRAPVSVPASAPRIPPEPARHVTAPRPASRVAAAPAPPLVLPKAQERLTESFKEKMQKVLLPKEVTPAAPSYAASKPPQKTPDVAPTEPLAAQRAPIMLPPAAKQEPVLSKGPPQRELYQMLQKADQSFNTPTAVPVDKTAVPASTPTATSRTSEEITRALERLSAPAVAAAAPGAPSASRAVALARCPQKAQKYCPLLEAAINRAWNADTNPGVRQALESAGNATATVRIVIQPNGEIREIRISASSGNEPYDRAVQSVLRELKRLPPLPEEMRDEPFVAVTSFTYAKKRDS